MVNVKKKKSDTKRNVSRKIEKNYARHRTILNFPIGKHVKKDMYLEFRIKLSRILYIYMYNQ